MTRFRIIFQLEGGYIKYIIETEGFSDEDHVFLSSTILKEGLLGGIQGVEQGVEDVSDGDNTPPDNSWPFVGSPLDYIPTPPDIGNADPDPYFDARCPFCGETASYPEAYNTPDQDNYRRICSGCNGVFRIVDLRDPQKLRGDFNSPVSQDDLKTLIGKRPDDDAPWFPYKDANGDPIAPMSSEEMQDGAPSRYADWFNVEPDNEEEPWQRLRNELRENGDGSYE